MRAFLSALMVLISLGLGGCVAPLPVEEYTIARAAVSAAKESGAERLAPGVWHKADESYRSGQKFLEEKDNDSARKSFLRAVDFAEKAENAARLRKFESGEPLQ